MCLLFSFQDKSSGSLNVTKPDQTRPTVTWPLQALPSTTVTWSLQALPSTTVTWPLQALPSITYLANQYGSLVLHLLHIASWLLHFTPVPPNPLPNLSDWLESCLGAARPGGFHSTNIPGSLWLGPLANIFSIHFPPSLLGRPYRIRSSTSPSPPPHTPPCCPCPLPPVLDLPLDSPPPVHLPHLP